MQMLGAPALSPDARPLARRDQLRQRYREDEGQPHWYSPIFKTPDVQSFIDSLIRTESDPPPRLPLRFTLTVAIPAESGSLHGWRIERLQVPGRSVASHRLHSFYGSLSVF
jgi:hypothetical protein